MTPVERRRHLAAKLREPLVNFEWDFGIIFDKWENKSDPHKCGAIGCAMGYGALLFPEEFEVTLDDDGGIKPYRFYNKPTSEVRPEDVAAALEALDNE